jgi:hypothetical protein
MKGAPAGEYVVQINPGGEYGGGQTVVDYPGPGGNYHQSWTINPPGDSSVALNMVQKWLRQAQLATTSIYADAE